MNKPYSIVFLALVAFSPAASANYLKPILSHDRVCLMGHAADANTDSGLVGRCFGKDGARSYETSIPDLAQLVHGNRIGGVTMEYSCAVAAGKLSCDGEGGESLMSFWKEYTHITHLAAGKYDVCIQDSQKGLNCIGGVYKKTLVPEVQITSIAQKRADKATRELVVGPLFACRILTDNSIECWGGLKPVYSSLLNAEIYSQPIDADIALTPKDLLNPSHLTVGLTHACVLEGAKPVCWGHDFKGETKVPAGIAHANDIEAGSLRTCAIMAGQPHCWGAESKLEAELAKPQPIPSYVSIALNKLDEQPLSYCSVDTEELRCSGPILNFNVKHRLRGFQLYDFEREFDHVATIIYKFKAPFIEEVANVTRNLKSGHGEPIALNRLFLMNVGFDFLNTISTEHMREVILPYFSKMLKLYNEQYKIKSLATFEKTPGLLTSTVRLLSSAFQCALPRIGIKEEREQIRRLQVALAGTLINQPKSVADLSGISEELDRMKPLIESLRKSPATYGLGKVITELAEVIR